MLDSAPHAAALIVIDMINDLDFEGGEDLREPAEAAAQRIVALRDAADEAGVPVIYVNDNFGHWHSERSSIIAHCDREDSPGRVLIAALRPRDRDYFVVKPQFSGFYATNLPVLLPQLGVTRVILTGVAADICVLFTAADAHMREYDLWVPGDTVASESDAHRRWALEIMRHSMCAETRPTDELALGDWLSPGA
ncbi:MULTISPECIES: isochorismatase family cysteine hydrolase [unclassified Sphingomonas]|uniref:cysteine hydrolase family protein n=1 Tax=unclassified Sphingomonas TaxID=196159 RepID=UPI00285E6A88|nr:MULTISPECIES: isochorismatase family cysteine hydrolase [unclassified Sphingomonas]MDR6114422.1 nicotinamidase-related amidase [Sphingomonas sp. SORGH_AS_0789]MDR6148218.1 nicotinamidase-related amidase [Sphingomonas sp. SORGH_AS_0742]